MCSKSDNVRNLLAALAAGDPSAADQLFPIVYEQLHRTAEVYMRHERSDHTLQPTALIHEAFLRLVSSTDQREKDIYQFENLDHFVSTAAVVMRRVLVNHAKAKKTKKRDGNRMAIEIDEIAQTFDNRSIDLVELDEALEDLKRLDLIQHQIVELRFFGGFTVEQCASFLDMSPRAVYYEWAHARAWLRHRLDRD